MFALNIKYLFIIIIIIIIIIIKSNGVIKGRNK